MLTIIRRYLKQRALTRYNTKVKAALAVLFPYPMPPLDRNNEQQRYALEYIDEYIHDAYAARLALN